MGYHCCVGICDNDIRYPHRIIKRGHVDEVKFHKFPTNKEKKDAWSAQISNGGADFNPGEYTYVCSNYFADGKPTTANPNPTLFLTISDNRKQSPVKRHHRDRSGPEPKGRRKILSTDSSNSEVDEDEDGDDGALVLSQCVLNIYVKNLTFDFYWVQKC